MSVHIFTTLNPKQKDLATHDTIKTKKGKRKSKKTHGVLDACP